MGKKEDYESRFEQILTPIVDENNFELVDVEYVKEAGTWYLRAYIDKEGGFTVDDCEFVSRKVSDILDREDINPDAYVLEIISPGLGSALKKEKDFKRSIGKDVDIKLYTAIGKQKEVTGTLESYDDKTIFISYEDGEKQEFERENVAMVRLSIDF